MPTREELENTFRRLGIDCSHPGFCETPAFLEAEQQKPRLLIFYAQYVDALTFDPLYLERARAVIRDTSAFLYRELVADGRRGGCIDIAQTVQRFLEQQETWVYFVGGGLRIEFPAAARLGPKWFWPIMHGDNPAVMGHAWVCAPPYKVIDLSFSLQPYRANEQKYLNGYVLIDECQGPAENTTIDDLVENEARNDFQRFYRRQPTLADLPLFDRPHLQQFMADFPSCKAIKDEIRLKYVPTKISAPDRPLDGMRNLQLRGRYPAQLYEEFQRERNADH
jgi:hypothetical protein